MLCGNERITKDTPVNCSSFPSQQRARQINFLETGFSLYDLMRVKRSSLSLTGTSIKPLTGQTAAILVQEWKRSADCLPANQKKAAV